jgi:hypothetical protein
MWRKEAGLIEIEYWRNGVSLLQMRQDGCFYKVAIGDSSTRTSHTSAGRGCFAGVVDGGGAQTPSKATARAGTRRFWPLSALRARANAPCKTDLPRETLRAINRPRRARTGAGNTAHWRCTSDLAGPLGPRPRCRTTCRRPTQTRLGLAPSSGVAATSAAASPQLGRGQRAWIAARCRSARPALNSVCHTPY